MTAASPRSRSASRRENANPTSAPPRRSATGSATRRGLCAGATPDLPRPHCMTRRKPEFVVVNDWMQKGYRYALTEPAGKNFDPEFRPELTPRQMLRLGVFGGKYMTDAVKEFPAAWFKGAKLSSRRRDSSLNYF